jgi:hypothetical protein
MTYGTLLKTFLLDIVKNFIWLLFAGKFDVSKNACKLSSSNRSESLIALTAKNNYRHLILKRVLLVYEKLEVGVGFSQLPVEVLHLDGGAPTARTRSTIT